MERAKTMSEYGFYHTSKGYWQVIDGVPDDVRALYPDGTIEIPLKPSANSEWDGEKWVI